MENRYNNRDFEQFVKQNADQYRMFPSEKVWDNIHNTLHVRRRWYGIGIALLLITITAVTVVMVNHPNKNQPIAQTLPAQPANLTTAASSAEDDVFIGPAKQQHKRSATNQVSNTNSSTQSYLPAFYSDELDSDPAQTTPVLAENNGVMAEPATIRTAAELPANGFARPREIALHHNNIRPSATKPVDQAAHIATSIVDNTINETPAPQNIELKSETPKDAGLLTIESVTNSYKNTRKAKKLSLMLSFTPVISYRDLRENTTFLRRVQAGNSTPIGNVYVPDINSIVTHKPDIGFQLGLTAGYPLSKRLTLTGGLQFSVSKYDIKAYSYQREETTIALTNNYGGTNTVSTYTSYRNIGGFRANWLRNLYVSASLPVGLELKIASGKKGYVGIGSTVQPTYVLDNRSYLLSTDYKNYAEMPSLIRKWNLNTSFEVFASNTTGKIKWRLGPQVRYQAMSSFVNKYPVMEHLFDFGFKLGVMLR